jgi:hypothetical protein
MITRFGGDTDARRENMNHHSEPVITKIPGGVNISLLALMLTLASYLFSVAGVVSAAGYWQGQQNARLAALETAKINQDGINLRQINANEAMADGFNRLAIELTQYRTIVDERTDRAELRNRQSDADNRAGISRNREAIAAASAAAKTVQPKKNKSLLTIIGVK